MKKSAFIFLLSISCLAVSVALAQSPGYSVGDVAMDFTLPSVDGSQISLSGPANSKGAIVIFTCNTCPFAKAYEERIISLHNTFASEGYPVIAINSNDEKLSPGDSFEEMKKRAKEKNFPFPYVYDKSQEVIKAYGGARTPQVFLLNKEDGNFVVKYIGAIDDNYQDADTVKEHYVEDAVSDVMKGKKVGLQSTKTIGCSIKWTKKSK